MKKILITALALSSIFIAGCAATNFKEDVAFKPIEGKPGYIYNPDYPMGFKEDGAPYPNLK